jgi:uncharacterized membrane protein (DUF2068 family)
MSSVANPMEVAGPARASQLRVLRTIATFELTKGLIVLLAAFGVFLLMQRDPWDVAEGFLRLLHISPDHHFAQVFLNWADGLTDQKLLAVALGASAYSIMRFAEAYGLWFAKTWAEWIALISGGLYVPFEVYKLWHRVSAFHVGVLLVNLAIVLYMAYVLWSGGSLHHLPKGT